MCLSRSKKGERAAPLKVLHLIDTGGPGGGETVFLNLVSGFTGPTWESIPVVPNRDWLHEALVVAGCQPKVVPSTGSFDIEFLASVVRLIRTSKADLIQTHFLTSSVYGSLAGRITGTPSVSTFHGHADAPPGSRLLRTKFLLLNRRRGRIVFVSEPLRSWFLDAFPLKKSQTRVIENGVVPPALGPRGLLRTRLRKELGIEENEFLVGVVGNVRPSKDYETLLAAAKRILDLGLKKIRFVIAGQEGGDLSRSLEELHDRLGLGEAVQFLGFRADMRDLYSAFDIYVLSSSSEGFSLTTVEAMAGGIPVVATRCGGPEDLIRDEVTGVLVEARNPRALSDAIVSLWTDPQRRNSLAAAARQESESRFSVEAMIAGYGRVYEELIGPVGASLRKDQPSTSDEGID